MSDQDDDILTVRGYASAPLMIEVYGIIGEKVSADGEASAESCVETVLAKHEGEGLPDAEVRDAVDRCFREVRSA